MSETAPTTWWWIRHAPVTSHGGRIYGQTDLPGDCGEEGYFTGLARILPEGALWLTSNLRRTRDTAEAVQRHRNPGGELLEPVAAFAEQHFGEWQGLRYEELSTRAGPEGHRFWLAPAETRPKGGESFIDLMERVHPAIREISLARRGEDIVAFAHGGTIRAALALALDLSPERALGFSIDNCSVTRIQHWPEGGHGPEAWRVVTVNQDPRPHAAQR